MKMAAIYARYSSDSQTEQSIEGQLRVCQQYAKDHDILVVDTYIDRAMTGTNDLRPDFQRMLRDSAKHQWEIVLVYKLDRFSRNKYESTIHKKTLKDNGVKLISAMEVIPEGPEGIILESLLEGMNAYYSAELAQKINRGLKESWIKGNATGGKGYYGYDVVDKKYIINEQEALVVAEIFTKYSQGFNARVIVESLTARGIHKRDGKPFTEKYLYKLLHNIRYTGKVYHNDVEYTNIFPQIISDDIWNKVADINDDNKISPSRKKEIFDYILSGKLICGNCKMRMLGISSTSHTGKIHYYYKCLSRNRNKYPCNTETVRKQELEDAVINTTVNMLKNTDTLHYIAERIYNLHKQKTEESYVLKSLIAQRNEAVKASNNLIKAIEMGIITEQTKQRLTELERQINQLDFDIDQEKQRTYTYLTTEDIENYLKSKIYDNPDNIKVRKLIVNTFIREIILYDEEIVITYNFSDGCDKVKFTPKHFEELENKIEESINENIKGASNFTSSPPKITPPRCGGAILLFG